MMGFIYFKWPQNLQAPQQSVIINLFIIFAQRNRNRRIKKFMRKAPSSIIFQSWNHLFSHFCTVPFLENWQCSYEKHSYKGNLHQNPLPKSFDISAEMERKGKSLNFKIYNFLLKSPYKKNSKLQKFIPGKGTNYDFTLRSFKNIVKK